MEALMHPSPTPISLIESYFDHDLKKSSVRFFDEVKDDTWIEFAKTISRRWKRTSLLAFWARRKKPTSKYGSILSLG